MRDVAMSKKRLLSFKTTACHVDLDVSFRISLEFLGTRNSCLFVTLITSSK